MISKKYNYCDFQKENHNSLFHLMFSFGFNSYLLLFRLFAKEIAINPNKNKITIIKVIIFTFLKLNN